MIFGLSDFSLRKKVYRTLIAMNKEAVRFRIRDVGLLPAIRVPSADDALFAARAILNGGIDVLELTTTVPGAAEVIAELKRTNPSLLVGAGTVLDRYTASRCLDAGAAFITSPGFDPGIGNFAAERDALFIPGAMSPSDVIAAHLAGAEMIKIFPCGPMGGPAYIKSLTPPFPEIAFIAAGGVSSQNAAGYIRAGAAALGIGSYLVPPDAVKVRNAGWIGVLCRRFANIVRQARGDSNRN
jgi:2-dehydro-3-deoxyphosphogluconate aldolase/(4S)-4-hydroxy-2-oxoglutarate aldolase